MSELIREQNLSYPRPGLRQNIFRAGGTLALMFIIVWDISSAGVRLDQTLAGLLRFAEFFGHLVPPDLDAGATVFSATLETRQITLAGTFLCIIASFILGLLDSARATWWQRIRFGILPQVGPLLARNTRFRFELNFRDSLVLGLVAEGGIGFYTQFYTRAFQYNKVAMLTIVVLVIVIPMEQISVALRRRLR